MHEAGGIKSRFKKFGSRTVIADRSGRVIFNVIFYQQFNFLLKMHIS